MESLSDALFDRAKNQGFETSGRQLDEALQLLERSTSADLNFNDLPYIYYEIARVHCARGDSEEAIKSLGTAIAIKDDAPEFYALWCEAKKGSARMRPKYPVAWLAFTVKPPRQSFVWATAVKRSISAGEASKF